MFSSHLPQKVLPLVRPKSLRRLAGLHRKAATSSHKGRLRQNSSQLFKGWMRWRLGSPGCRAPMAKSSVDGTLHLGLHLVNLGCKGGKVSSGNSRTSRNARRMLNMSPSLVTIDFSESQWLVRCRYRPRQAPYGRMPPRQTNHRKAEIEQPNSRFLTRWIIHPLSKVKPIGSKFLL